MILQAGSVYFAAFSSRLLTTCRNRPGSPRTRSTPPAGRSDTTCRRSSMTGCSARTASRTTRRQVETFRPDLDQAAADARQVEELVYESQEYLRLGIDRLDQFDRFGIPVALPQQIDGVRNGRQRVTQLVPQCGDELILALAAGDESRHHVRASGDVMDCEQQLIAAIGIAGDSPRAQRQYLSPVGREIPRDFAILQRLGVRENARATSGAGRGCSTCHRPLRGATGLPCRREGCRSAPRMQNSRAVCATFHRALPAAGERTR